MKTVELTASEIIDLRRFIREMIDIRNETIDKLQKLENFQKGSWAYDYANVERRDIEICKALLDKISY